MFTDTGQLRESWNKWYQDVVDSLNHHQSGIADVNTEITNVNTTQNIAEKQHYEDYKEHICDGTEGNEYELPSAYMVRNLKVYVDRRRCHREEHLDEVYAVPILDDDSLYRRVGFYYNGVPFTLSAGTILGFDWMAS